MEIIQFFRTIKRNIGIIILSGMLVSSLSFLFIVFNEKNFQADTEYLIVQTKGDSSDLYSILKSSEFIGKVLGEVVYSELFIDEMLDTKKVSEEFLPFNRSKRLKEWAKTIKIEKTSELGIISIKILGKSQEEVKNISEAVSQVLMDKNYLFKNEAGLEIVILSGPIVEKNPTTEGLIILMVSGFILGSILSSVWIFYKEMIVNNYSGEVYLKENDRVITSEEYEENIKYLDENK